ncbi:MAG: hypothetical protein LKG20_05140 [Tetrasphaera jenkinsii]|nr:hypothetical protein [Tetrasphaera jenkinsii]
MPLHRRRFVRVGRNGRIEVDGRAGGRRFRGLVRARYAALVRAAYLLTGSREGAEDLVQDVLVRAGANWSRIIGRGHP